MRNQELILFLPNGNLELYPHILSLYLHIWFYHLTNVDAIFTMIKYHDG
jgi:hypothetical protein